MSLLEQASNATPDTGSQTPPAAESQQQEQSSTEQQQPHTDQTAPAEQQGLPDQLVSEWYYDENLKGSGNRPEWLKDKYKSAADQAKAYLEVEKKLGAFKGAPEKYDLTLPEHPEIKFSEEDPMLKDFLEKAKKNGVSQEYVSELLGTYAQALTSNIPDPQEEMRKLGPNGQQDLQILNQWASSQFTPEEYGYFKNAVTTADAVRFFDKIRMMATRSDVAEPAPARTHRETEEQVKQMIYDPRYDKDETFREEVRKRLAVAMAHKK